MMRSPSFGLRPVVSVSRITCLTWNSFIREPIGSFVFGVPRVSPHPVPFYVVLGGELVQPPPQILVLDGLLVGRAPAAALPVLDPGRNPFHDVERVGVDPHAAPALESFERADRGHELHAVVRGVGLAAPELLLLAVVAQEHAPAAGTGVAAAGAVAVDLDDAVSHGGSDACSCASFAKPERARGAAPAPAATPG